MWVVITIHGSWQAKSLYSLNSWLLVLLSPGPPGLSFIRTYLGEVPINPTERPTYYVDKGYLQGFQGYYWHVQIMSSSCGIRRPGFIWNQVHISKLPLSTFTCATPHLADPSNVDTFEGQLVVFINLLRPLFPLWPVDTFCTTTSTWQLEYLTSGVMGLDIPAGTPNRGPSLIAFSLILLVLTTLMTLIRVISKTITKQYWWWDDLFALLSWVGGFGPGRCLTVYGLRAQTPETWRQD